MRSSVSNVLITVGLVVIGVCVAAAGIHIGESDDAPGAALIGILLMMAATVMALRRARHKAT